MAGEAKVFIADDVRKKSVALIIIRRYLLGLCVERRKAAVLIVRFGPKLPRLVDWANESVLDMLQRGRPSNVASAQLHVVGRIWDPQPRCQRAQRHLFIPQPCFVLAICARSTSLHKGSLEITITMALLAVIATRAAWIVDNPTSIADVKQSRPAQKKEALEVTDED